MPSVSVGAILYVGFSCSIMGCSMDIFDRFANKVNVTDTCWLWTGSKRNVIGHGKFAVGVKAVLAHRWSYEIFKGTIPEGLELDHICKVPSCVNPNHLEPVTHQENLLRGKHIKKCKHGLRARSHCAECSADRKKAYWTISNPIYYAAKKHGMKISIKTTPDGTRLWRLS